ncbi:MAG: hypothetical protein HC819_07350 [Cyclobacteriaceae bacterium]|nr:hypothetical protein [Cyclobacteriaceae bacterium]
MNIKCIALLLMASLAMFSCETESSGDVAQDRIFTNYELIYLQDEDKTQAKAIFTFGTATGTRLQLAEGAIVTFNDQPIPYNSLLGMYELELSGLTNSGTFKYVDLENKTFTNTVQLRAIGFAATVPSKIDRSKSTEITWTGEPVGAGVSSVVATVVPNNLGQTKLFIEADEGAKTVILNPVELLKIDPQPAKLFIERKDVPIIQQASSAGGLLTASYRAASVSVTLE